MDGAPDLNEGQEPQRRLHRAQSPATLAVLAQGAISLKYNTTVTYLCNKNKSILKLEIRGTISMAFVGFLSGFSTITGGANKCITSLPVFSVDFPDHLRVVSMPSTKKDRLQKMPESCVYACIQSHSGHTLMRELPVERVPGAGAPASLPYTNTQQLRGS